MISRYKKLTQWIKMIMLFLSIISIPLLIIYFYNIFYDNFLLGRIQLSIFSTYILVSYLLFDESIIKSNSIFIKFLKYITQPGQLFITAVGLFIPLSSILIRFLIYLLIVAFVPLIIYGCLYFYTQISKETIFYICFTIFVFILIIPHKTILTVVNKVSFETIFHNDLAKSFNLDEITNYFLSEKNIRFIVYMIYFLLLIIVNYFQFENLTILSSLNSDKALIQSFATFLAFDKIITFLKDVEFTPEEFFNKIINAKRNTNE